MERVMMNKKVEKSRRKGSPISDSLGSDLNKLTNVLSDHTRGLNDYLQRQAQSIKEREVDLLAENGALLLNQGIELDDLSKIDLQEICRVNRLRGWSRLRQKDLVLFIRRELGSQVNNLHHKSSFSRSAHQKDLSNEIQELRESVEDQQKRIEEIGHHVQELDSLIRSELRNIKKQDLKD